MRTVRIADDADEVTYGIRCEVGTEALARVWTRLKPTNFELFELNLFLDPPAKRLTWRKPIDLKLDVIRNGEKKHKTCLD